MGSNMDKIYIVMNYVEHDLKSLMETMKQPFLPGGACGLGGGQLQGGRPAAPSYSYRCGPRASPTRNSPPWAAQAAGSVPELGACLG